MQPTFAELVSRLKDLQEIEYQVELQGRTYLRRIGYLNRIDDLKVERVNTGSGLPDYISFAFRHAKTGCVTTTYESFRVPVLAVQRTMEAE